MPVLLRLPGEDASQIDAVLEVGGDDLVIGRGADAGIPLIDESVSRAHARIVRVGDRWSVLTLNAANPVRVGGEAVERLELAPGQAFTLGRVALRFELEDPRERSTVNVEGDAAAAVIAEVSAARAAQQQEAAAPMDPVSARNPFLNPAAPRPSQDAVSRSALVSHPPAPTGSPGLGAGGDATPTPIAPQPSGSPGAGTGAPMGADAPTPGPVPYASTEPTTPARPRIWPSVVLASVLALGVVAAVFHRPLLRMAGVGTDDGDVVTAEGDVGDADDAADGDDGRPVGVLAGWRRADPLACAVLEDGAPADTDLGRALKQRGRPSGYWHGVDADDEVHTALVYANDGERLDFLDGKAAGTQTVPVDPTAGPLPGPLALDRFEVDTDPRCLVVTSGEARVLSLASLERVLSELERGANPLGAQDPALGWSLGASGDAPGWMVTVGPQLRLLRLGAGEGPDGLPGTTWVGRLDPGRSSDGSRPLVLVHEGPGEFRSIELVRASPSPAAPGLRWRHPRREAPMDLVFEPGDEVRTRIGADAEGEDPAYLHAKLGLIDLLDTHVQVRDFELSFQYADQKFEYNGVLTRTPWRESPE